MIPSLCYKIRILLLLLLVSLRGAYGYNFRHLTINDGLSNNAVYSIFQDTKGFMWFGTIDGIHCFDGKHLRVVQNQQQDIHISNLIYAIEEDDSQRLWLGTDEGLALYSLKEERFIPFCPSKDTIKYNDVRIYDIFKDSRKCMWIGTSGKGLISYNLKSKEMHHYTTPDLPSLQIRDIMEDKKGRIWVTSLDKGVACIDPQTEKITKYSNPDINSGLLTFEDAHANIWVGTAGNGLFLINPETGQITRKIKPVSNHAMLQIRDIAEPAIGELLLTSDEGLISYHIGTDTYKIIKADPTQQRGLNDNYLHSLFIDNEKGIWVGSYFGGVNYISPTSDNFSYYSCNNSPFKGKVISAFARDENENLWVGTDDSGFFYWNRSNNSFKEFYPKQGDSNSPTYQNVHALLPDGDKLYIGMYMGGLDILDLKTNQIKNYNTGNKPNMLYSSGVYALYKDLYGKIWVGTSKGLNCYNPTTDDFERIAEVSGVDVTSVLEDQKGYLWASTLGGGVYRLDRKSNKWRCFRYSDKDKNTLPVNKVITIALDQRNNLWFGTDGGGLCRFDYETESFQDYTTVEFPSKVIYKIIPENDYLWISGSKGLIKFQPEQKTLHVFNKFDGLQDNQFSPNAGVRMKDGTIYFGGINGFNGFRPADMIQNNQTPTLVFTNFSLFNKKVLPNEEGSPLRNSITYTDRLILDKDQSIFSIEFATLSYTGSHKNRYKYMLEGFETDWTETNDPSVTYTNLPAGNYTFRVKASNGDGIWNEEGIAMPIKVLPPVWLSLPFLITYIIAVLSILILYFQYIKRRHKKEIAYLSVEKEKEIYSTKINFFTHIVHEIRTPLTLILGPLKNIMSTKGEIAEVMPQLELIERNGSRLLSLVNQLMDFQKVEDGGMSVITQECCINDQLEDVYKRFRLSAELKNISFRLQLPDKKLYALLDEEAFNKILSNLLSNALKFTGNSIELQLAADAKYAVISVSDNGPGIERNEQDNIFKPFYQIKESRPSDYIGTGIGLLLVKKLAEMQNGEIKVESERGKGSVFSVRFPLFQPQNNTERSIEQAFSEAPESQPLQVLKTRPSVLLVDDNRDLLTFLSETLSDDYEIQCCMDGNEAITYLKTQSADLIISDVMMPNMDGFELCTLLKSNILTSHIPVLLLTAKVGTEDRIQGLDNGADVYVEKPFSTNVLKAQINSLLRNRERIRRSFREKSNSSLTVIANTKVDEEFLQKIHQYIEENISDTQLSVDMIARQVGMGRSNFFLKVKSLSEMTPNELIRIIRLKKAKSLFDSGETCVSDICFRVGFSSPSYFGKCFMQEYGVTPSEYIKTIKDRSEYA